MGDCTKNSDGTNEYVTGTVGDRMVEGIERVYGLIDNDEVIKNELDDSA